MLIDSLRSKTDPAREFQRQLTKFEESTFITFVVLNNSSNSIQVIVTTTIARNLTVKHVQFQVKLVSLGQIRVSNECKSFVRTLYSPSM